MVRYIIYYPLFRFDFVSEELPMNSLLVKRVTLKKINNTYKRKKKTSTNGWEDGGLGWVCLEDTPTIPLPLQPFQPSPPSRINSVSNIMKIDIQ